MSWNARTTRGTAGSSSSRRFAWAAVGDRPKAQIARELGIRVNQLRKWRLDFEEEERTGAPKRVPTSEEDLGRLRRENAKLKEENEILKKAAIYFARELT